ncbi:MAG: Gfo/Idh/MocA family oxidoreductase [Spirochaetes bacterium]|nr:Gfo/Idh/MocA family oxidoreductase [Spirochaetota bacterium]
MSNYNVAIIGTAGHGGYVKSVSADNAFRINITAVSGNANELTVLTASYPGAVPYASLVELVAKERIHIAVVNPEFSLLAETASLFIRNRIPVFMDKPFALSYETLAELAALAKQYRTPVYPMFDMRYRDAFYTARALVRSGAIGETVLISAQKSYKLGERAPFFRSRKTYGGTIPWIAIHAVDFIRYVTDVRYTSVSARHTVLGNAGHGELESAAVMNFTTAGGALVSVTADYLRPGAAPSHGDDRLRVAGTKGVIEIRGGKLFIIDAKGERDAALDHPPRQIFDDVIACVEGNTDTLTDASDGFYATAVSLAARDSADRGETVSLDAAAQYLVS